MTRQEIKLIKQYAKVSGKKSMLDNQEKEIKEKLKDYMRKKKINKKEVVINKNIFSNGQLFSLTFNVNPSESLLKEKVKKYLSDYQYKQCLKVTDKERFTINAIKESKLKKGGKK